MSAQVSSFFSSLSNMYCSATDVIAYQIRQSFKPGEVTPEEANRIGYELAKRFLKERHAFFVATHCDTAHIHNVRPDRAMRKAV